MNQPLTINVDTIEFAAEGEGLFLRGAETVFVYNADGTQKTRTQNRVSSVKAKDGAHQFTVSIGRNGSLLKYSGSAFGYICGQNMYTPGSVRDACIEARYAIKQEFGEGLLHGENKLRTSDFRLTRVDLACNLDLEKPERALAVLKQAKRQLCEIGYTADYYATGFCWRPSHGEEYLIRGYMKSVEMQKTRKHKISEAHAQLVRESAGVVRIELQLRGRALNKLGLRNPNAWMAGTEQRIFEQYMKRLPLSDVRGGPIMDDELLGMSESQKRALILYATDPNWKEHYGKSTVQRYIREMRKFGWDMRQPFTDDVNVVQVKSAFHLEKMMKELPDWLVDVELYPEYY